MYYKITLYKAKMQIINHKNASLTICQKFFIEKSVELLYIGSIDSYRVRLNNPRSILIELLYCLQEYDLGRIKHFQTIKAKEKDKKAIIDEAISLLNYSPNYLKFNSVSQSFLELLFKTIDEHNYKKVISSVNIILNENLQYVEEVILGLENLIRANEQNKEELEKIDKALNIILSELIRLGYAKGFLYKLIYGIFVSSLLPDNDFYEHFNNFRNRILDVQTEFNVIFRIDTTQKVYDSITAIPNQYLSLSDNIDFIQIAGRFRAELASFNAPAGARKFISCKIISHDYSSALKHARYVLSEYLDVINLGLAEELLKIHHRALVIDSRSPEKGAFQNNVNILDGKYIVEKDHYISFTKKLPDIFNNDKVQTETKQKIKSAVRYLRLGNESTEVEHKFINYWIGLEYLFSNYESQSTIIRIKDHFINAHALAYVKRNLYSFKKSISQLSQPYQLMIPTYNSTNTDDLLQETFYTEISTALLNDYPLIAYRAMKLKQWLFHTGKAANATDYLNNHKANLEIHFTRIYRLRNEIIHDAATDTNNEQISSNLRYYLTFILNELIDFLSKVTDKETSIEDYFILNEIKIGNIGHNGYLLNDLLEVDCSIGFIS